MREPTVSDPIVEHNAIRCPLCESPAHRYETRYECTNRKCGALGDLRTGQFERMYDPFRGGK